MARNLSTLLDLICLGPPHARAATGAFPEVTTESIKLTLDLVRLAAERGRQDLAPSMRVPKAGVGEVMRELRGR
jgi:hypothetical protein